ncbi:MAG: AAA family ATPase, partial [Clostridia bacterium]|nr:AAA family ATPase [Clostridia bacterium]
MSNYLNLGNEKFQISLDSEIYVDKTGLIEYTNKTVSTRQRFICVARPRRFGKTMAAEMLEAYYCRGCDSHTQFDGLAVSKTEKYEAHINKYNVIHINMVEVLSDEKNIENGLQDLKSDLADDMKTEFSDIAFKKEELISMFKTVYGDTGFKFVFIIDEWDCPFRERKDDTEGQRKYTMFLRDILKDQSYVALAYMTGIHTIKKFCDNSSLNMFQEFSMEMPGPVKQYFGFTDDEVKALCAERGFSYDGIRDWYDGYVFENKPGEDLHMYNSNSVVSAI